MSVCDSPSQKLRVWEKRGFLQEDDCLFLAWCGSAQTWPHPCLLTAAQEAALRRRICLLSSRVPPAQAPTKNAGSTLPPMTRPLSEQWGHGGTKRTVNRSSNLLTLNLRPPTDNSAVNPAFNLSSFTRWWSEKQPSRAQCCQKLHIFKAHIKASKVPLISSSLQHPLPPTPRPQTDFNDPWGVLILFITVSFPV